MEESDSTPKSLMENLLGLLRVRVKRGVNLAVRDVRSSDPYVVIKMYRQVSFFIFLFLFLKCNIFGYHVLISRVGVDEKSLICVMF